MTDDIVGSVYVEYSSRNFSLTLVLLTSMSVSCRDCVVCVCVEISADNQVALRLTVEVETDRCVALPELVFGGDPVLSGVLDGDVDDLQHRKVGVPVLLHNHLRNDSGRR